MNENQESMTSANEIPSVSSESAPGSVNIEEPIPFSGVAPENGVSEKTADIKKTKTKSKKKSKENKEEKVNISAASNAFELVSVFVSALVVIAIVFVFVARPVGVNGESMLPTLQNGDWLLISPLYREPEYGDIIVSYPPSAFDEPLIKRVIAVGGQKVDIDFEQGIVYVDDVPLDELYYVNTPTTKQTSYDQQFPLYVPYGYVFMCGDNRNGSTDSRSTLVGFVREEYILGRAIGRIIPFGDWDIYKTFKQAVGKA